MKLLLVIVSLPLLWLSGCQKDSRSIGKNDFDARWTPIIAFLNQAAPSHEKALLEGDLHQLYERECGLIEARWNKMPHGKCGKRELLTKKNAFFCEEISKLNNETLKGLLNKDDAPPILPRDHDALAAAILRQVLDHPIASTAQVPSYTDGMEIGFCFGRALLVHYYLLKAGIPPSAIFKVFALGDLKVSGQFWHFHVAVMIKTQDGFLVIDPLYNEAQSYPQWQKDISRFEIKHPFPRARFYITDARKFMPHGSHYAISALREPVLERYFYDLSKTLK